jgi:hypothetical protein
MARDRQRHLRKMREWKRKHRAEQTAYENQRRWRLGLVKNLAPGRPKGRMILGVRCAVNLLEVLR